MSVAQVDAALALSGRSNAREWALPPSLRDVRHTRGLSLSQVEDLSGLNRGRISELERGERNPRTTELELLAKIYQVAGWRVLSLVVLDEAAA